MTQDPPAKSAAPWDAAQVANLNGFQQAGWFHPFTCPRDHDPDQVARYGHIVLEATGSGWTCPADTPDGPPCGYRQDWAYLFMANGNWREMAEAIAAAYTEPRHAPEGTHD